MTQQEKDYLAELGVWFYGTRPSAVNERLGDVLAKMLHATLETSRRLDLVPHPAGMKPGYFWLVNQSVQIFWRSEQNRSVYEMAKRTVALRWRSEYAMAEMGL